jgi:adenosylhomocysteinase
MRAKGLGADVVSEVDPLKALEAVMDGFRSCHDRSANPGSVRHSAGDINVIDTSHGRHEGRAIVCNSGHQR